MLDYDPGLSLATRATSGLPLSIGTSLAFESVFMPVQKPYDDQRKIPNQVDINKYNSFWINVTTLFRNLVSAVEKDVFLKARVPDLCTTIEEEIGVISALFEEAGNTCKPYFYYSTYDNLKSSVKSSRHVSVMLREPSTENQRYMNAMLEETLKLLNRHTESIVVFKDTVHPDNYDHSVILTHQPYDLVGYRKFNTLDLLESNTGILKSRHQWNTKYHAFGVKDLSHLPFNKKLLLVFGDKVLIKPGHNSMREQIYEISVKRNWTPATTLDKINLDIEHDVRDPALFAILKSYGL